MSGLKPPTGTFLEVELRRGTAPDALDMKSQDIRAGAAKINANERAPLRFMYRIMPGLYLSISSTTI